MEERSGDRPPPLPSRTAAAGAAQELAGALFDVIDADGGGDLDEQETKRYLSVLGTAEAELDERWSTMLAAADTDGDGMIDREEFLTYILKDEELTEDGAFVDAGREGELTHAIVILQMGGSMDDVKAAEEIERTSAPPAPPRGPPVPPAASPPPPTPPPAGTKAKEPRKSGASAVVEELSNAGGAASLKKVNKMELLMHKKKTQKKETALEQ